MLMTTDSNDRARPLSPWPLTALIVIAVGAAIAFVVQSFL
jgi:hypothetical protein